MGREGLIRVKGTEGTLGGCCTLPQTTRLTPDSCVGLCLNCQFDKLFSVAADELITI